MRSAERRARQPAGSQRRLSKQVERLKTPAGVEDYARSQLGMAKKGENVVVVVDGQKPVETAA